MRDSWKTSFQDRLGEYELDVPEAAAVAGHRVAWPWILAAAAAITAVFLLLPTRKPVYGTPGLSACLREEPVGLLAESIPHPLPLTHPGRRPILPPNPGQPDTPSGQDLSPAFPESTPEDIQQDSPDVTPESTPEITPEITPEADIRTAQWTGEPVSAPARKTGRLSTQLYLGNGFSSSASPVPEHSSTTSQNTGPRYEEVHPLMSNSIYASAFSKPEEWFTTLEDYLWNYDLPVKAGLSLRYQITPLFGLESGLEYSFHHARGQKIAGNKQQEARSYSFHYIGVPLKASLRLAQWNRIQAYTTVGAEAEWLAAGSFISKDSQKTVAVRINEHPLQYALMGAAGIDLGLTSRLSLYAEPGLSWHFPMKGTLPSYYREHPLSFDLRAGLRFELN